ncbi:hypothetical protein Pint_14671 [Pistacia integerrima]|uniref:Uncharacterized protein n=1 Tax=Pistacia integerrima TaxID=434235 RepID=A0ACC0Y7N9_9ROSI|nr:hypothetical protein Pint_14671 [Pistacia integerrima]
MIVNGVSPDEITMVSLVSASAKLRDVKMGEALHLYIEEKNLSIVGSSVDMYIKCGKMEEAQKLLDRCGADDVDVVLGTTLISGYVKSHKIDAARFLFDQMTERSLISWTAMISGYVQDLYAKSEQVNEACRIFEQLPYKTIVTWNSINGNIAKARAIFDVIPEKDVISWNTMINCYARYNQFQELFELFHKMQSSHIKRVSYKS